MASSFRLWTIEIIWSFLGVERAPTCWTLIHRERQTRALVAAGADLFLLDHGGQCSQQRPDISAGNVGEYTDMAVSADNSCLALFTDTGLLWIGSADLQVC